MKFSGSSLQEDHQQNRNGNAQNEDTVTWEGFTIKFETDRLIIREFTVDDWKRVHAYASDVDSLKFVEWGPNSEDATKDYVTRMMMFQRQSPREVYELAIVFKENGSVIGGCGLHVEEHLQAELGYCLNRRFWGNGFATEAAYALCEFGFIELKLHRIFATCRPDNPASWKLMEKIGMTREGLLREHMFWKEKWQSSFVYSILAGEFAEQTGLEALVTNKKA